MKIKKTVPIRIRPGQWLSGILGLASVSLLSLSEPANASSLTCSSGNNWVSTCTSGIAYFSNSVINATNLFSPNNQPDFSVLRTGITGLIISNPVDAIVNDPLLGNVGSLDGQLDVVKIEVFEHSSTGFFPFPPMLETTVLIGDGTPDLAPTPPDATLPYESLYAAGAIVQRQDNSALADSFLKVFLAVEGAEGFLRNQQPLTLTSVSPLTSFSLGNSQNAFTYASHEIIPLFVPGADGIFWTGDEVEFARIVPDSSGSSVVLTLTSIPEPSAASALALVGLAIMFRLSKSKPPSSC